MKQVQNFVRSTLVFVPEASFPSGEKLLPIECWGTQGPGHGVPKPPCACWGTGMLVCQLGWPTDGGCELGPHGKCVAKFVAGQMPH